MVPWLLVVLTATPQVDLVLTRRVETTAERGDDVTRRVHDALAAEGLAPNDPTATKKRLNTDPTVCAGKHPCIVRLGADLGSTVLITVDVGHLSDRMAVSLEAIDPKTGKKLAQRAFVMNSLGYPAGLDAELKPFAQAVAALDVLKPAPAKPEVAAHDAPFQPTAPELLPPPPPPMPPLEASGSKPRPWGLISSGVLTAATAVTAIVFLTLALINQGQLSSAHTTFDGVGASKLTQRQALGYASDANTDYTVSLCTGLGAAALAGLTVFFWRSGD